MSAPFFKKIFYNVMSLFCEHEYIFLTSYHTDIDATIGYEYREVFRIYCPNCRKEKTVLKHEYEAIMKKQELNKEFKKKWNS